MEMASASPSARLGGSPQAGMSGAGVIDHGKYAATSRRTAVISLAFAQLELRWA
jgi:hypothetical protein